MQFNPFSLTLIKLARKLPHGMAAEFIRIINNQLFLHAYPPPPPSRPLLFLLQSRDETRVTQNNNHEIQATKFRGIFRE